MTKGKIIFMKLQNFCENMLIKTNQIINKKVIIFKDQEYLFLY